MENVWKHKEVESQPSQPQPCVSCKQIFFSQYNSALTFQDSQKNENLVGWNGFKQIT